ncbi:MAG: zinc ribbon domain-containing protein [Lachnospiraceae bacterium]|nr:zinc ribbon domain-containing protein [Lachnospiraceae bacterium]
MKNCPKCGVQLPDDAVFCNNCGNNLSAEPQQAAPAAEPVAAPVNNATLDSAVEKNKNTKIGMIAIIGGAAVVVILLVCLLISSLGGGYKSPINDLVKALNKESTNYEDFVNAVAPDFVATACVDLVDLIRDVDADVIEDFEEDIADSLEDGYDDWADDYGDNWRISVDFRDEEELDEDELEEIQELYEDFYDSLDDMDLDDEETYEDLADYLEDYYDMELSDSQINKLQKICEALLGEFEDVEVTEGYVLDVKLTIEGREDDDDEKMDITVICVNGSWCIDLLGMMGINDIGDLYWYL